MWSKTSLRFEGGELFYYTEGTQNDPLEFIVVDLITIGDVQTVVEKQRFLKDREQAIQDWYPDEVSGVFSRYRWPAELTPRIDPRVDEIEYHTLSCFKCNSFNAEVLDDLLRNIQDSRSTHYVLQEARRPGLPGRGSRVTQIPDDVLDRFKNRIIRVRRNPSGTLSVDAGFLQKMARLYLQRLLRDPDWIYRVDPRFGITNEENRVSRLSVFSPYYAFEHVTADTLPVDTPDLGIAELYHLLAPKQYV